ncbi:Hypothetical predicted protein [Octopus vulgaris]|uniref:Transmembrane protein n=1 Tax=Octopus vulgaris TaxID=6645 RepID=A0AA36FE58_OCTVU|nr:Hypothetical predicted protein [Octopus vulgaris]
MEKSEEERNLYLLLLFFGAIASVAVVIVAVVVVVAAIAFASACGNANYETGIDNDVIDACVESVVNDDGSNDCVNGSIRGSDNRCMRHCATKGV